MNFKDASGENLEVHEKHVIGNGGKVILVVKKENTWGNYVLVFWRMCK